MGIVGQSMHILQEFSRFERRNLENLGFSVCEPKYKTHIDGELGYFYSDVKFETPFRETL